MNSIDFPNNYSEYRSIDGYLACSTLAYSDYYSNLDKNAHFRPTPGDYCVAMYTEDARWYRARLIRYVSGICLLYRSDLSQAFRLSVFLDQICEVFYVDYGNLEELPIDLVHELLPAFARLPARAIACTIAEVMR